jgi:hypothetical protein
MCQRRVENIMKALSGRFFVILLMILILTEDRAHAYVDPGTGSMLWQVLFAAGVGTLFYFRKVFAWVGSLRKRKKSVVAPTPPPLP